MALAGLRCHSSNVYNNKIINLCQLRRAEQSLYFASIRTNFSNFIILRPRPRTYAYTSPLILLQLHQQQQLLSINIINSTNHPLQHAKLRILLQHFTSHAAYERSGGPPKRPAAKRPCISYNPTHGITLFRKVFFVAVLVETRAC